MKKYNIVKKMYQIGKYYRLLFMNRYFQCLSLAVAGKMTAMITVDIPGYGRLDMEHFVTDFSGTLSDDGTLIPGV